MSQNLFFVMQIWPLFSVVEGLEIVTSSGGYIPFCSASFARQIERIGRQVHGYPRWCAVTGQ